MGDLPQDCNSLRRINDKLDFCKENCEWYFSNKQRTIKAKRLFDRKIPIQDKKRMMRIVVPDDIYSVIKQIVGHKVEEKNEEKIVREFISNTLTELFFRLPRQMNRKTN